MYSIRFKDANNKLKNQHISNKKHSTREGGGGGGGGAGPAPRRPRGHAAGRGRSSRRRWRRRDEGGVNGSESEQRVCRRKPLGRAVVSSHYWAQWAEAHLKPAQPETAFAAAAKETKRNGGCFRSPCEAIRGGGDGDDGGGGRAPGRAAVPEEAEPPVAETVPGPLRARARPPLHARCREVT